MKICIFFSKSFLEIFGYSYQIHYFCSTIKENNNRLKLAVMKAIIRISYLKNRVKNTAEVTIDIPVEIRKEIRSCGEITILDEEDVLCAWANTKFNPDTFQMFYNWNEVLGFEVLNETGKQLTEHQNIWYSEILNELDESDETDLFFAVMDVYDREKENLIKIPSKSLRKDVLISMARENLIK